ncbi:MAG: hypothetical protein PHV93_01515 [Candidatus Pacebacteria bacterium]|nr:hypothetical protein [Candidatus Paceibacterota bacterium]
MDPKLQTSFIPKKALTDGDKVSGGINLVSLITALIFIITLATAGGLYVYSGVIDKQVTKETQTLKQNEDALELPTLEQYIRLDDRIEAAKQILHNHIAVTPIFDTLQKTVLKSIQFSDLTLTFGGPDKISLAMKGQTLNYGSIAYQSDIISKDEGGLLKNPIFSDLNLDASGNVTFSFAATLDPSLILYERNLNTGLPDSTSDATGDATGTPAEDASSTSSQ